MGTDLFNSVATRDRGIRRFIVWCEERSLGDPRDITKPILERYQKHLFYYRKSNGETLSYGTQTGLVTAIKSLFKWLAGSTKSHTLQPRQ